MRSVVVSILMGIVMAGAAFAQSGTNVSVETMPPSVVKTFPIAGDIAVDPSLKEIRVTFSKDMMTNNQWSWVMMSKDTFPKMTGQPRFLEDARTCVLPVKMEAGKTYVIWLNKGEYNYFKDRGGRSAVPYLLVFQTRK